MAGAAHDVGTTFAAIKLARTLAEDANVVLVDLAFGAPNLSVISTDPNAPGIAELARGQASFGDVITRDQYSGVHMIATGNIGQDGVSLAASPQIAVAIDALAHSYAYVVIDVGAISDPAAERFAPLAQRAVLVTADPAQAATGAAHQRMAQAGFGQVSVVAGVSEATAA